MGYTPLPAENELEQEQQIDLARRRWRADLDLAARLDTAAAERRNSERDVRVLYRDRCAEAHRAHREAITEVEALALEARLEAQQLAAGGR